VPEKAERDFGLGHQIKKERPYIFEAELLDGLPEELGVMLDTPNVLVLSARGELAELKIFDEPLAHGSHGSLLGAARPSRAGKTPRITPIDS
jgi:hypothetical protein